MTYCPAPAAGRVSTRARTVLLALGTLGLAALGAAEPAAPGAISPENPAAIAQQLRSFETFGSVLYVAAHPDDENTQLITYLARCRDYRTAYLSLTRGDGGQNLLGPEFGDLLGVIRTQELLAARRLDGGRQFFSRARDFGYSKDYRQTLTKWDHQQVLADVVRVIRTFRPDVIITRFSPEPASTHGHHTASAALALEAFRLAGDPTAFPDQLPALQPWQPRRILWNGFGAAGGTLPAGVLHVAIDGDDPVTGASFAVLAAKSRSMHRTQGFANFSVAAGGGGPRIESFQVLAGEPAAHDLMDGVDVTWGRIPGGAPIGAAAANILAHFDPAHPAASVPALLELRSRLAAVSGDAVVAEKRLQLDRILIACLGLEVTATVPTPEVVPGEKLRVRERARVQAAVAVIWESTLYPNGKSVSMGHAALGPSGTEKDERWTLPKDTPLTEPYWLRERETPGMFRVSDPTLIGRPESPPSLPVEDTFLVGGQTLVVPHAIDYVPEDPAAGPPQPADVVAPVSVAFISPVQLFEPGSSREVKVAVAAVRADMEGSLRLDVPAGWSVKPRSQRFHVLEAGHGITLAFAVTAPAAPENAEIGATARVGFTDYNTGHVAISYPHIPPQLLQPPARLRAVCLELGIRGKMVGYLPGAGDSTAESLRQMGYTVRVLGSADLTPEGLQRLDAVVIGIRAFNTRADLPAHLPALFGYVQNGGTVVDEYNTPGGLQTTELAPYPLKLSRELPRFRVTDEDSAVTMLQPDDRALTEPNVITALDFEGWVQERGLDFASEWDEHFTPLLACSDAGEPPLKGGLLVAHYGRGIYIYTGLSFFRQFPAGVPGAYRLFANLVSLGK